MIHLLDNRFKNAFTLQVITREGVWRMLLFQMHVIGRRRLIGTHKQSQFREK